MHSPEVPGFQQAGAELAGKNEGQNHESSLTVKERLEELEAAITVHYEDFLIEHDPVNAGNDGLIYRMTIEEVSEDLKQVLEESGVEVEGASAIKLLKVYNRGKARQEYETHRRAFELTRQARGRGEQVALVPRPLDCRHLKISESTRRVLNGRGANLTSNEVEILTMDFVEGKDILDICNRWIYDHAPEEYQTLLETLNPDDRLQLMKAVSIILKYNQMPPKGTPEEARELSDRREKSLLFLKRTNFNLADSIVVKIKNTRNILESNRIYHNDDHERNFMIQGDPTGANGEPEVFEIDFGRAGEQPESEIRFFLEKHLESLTAGFKEAERKRQENDRRGVGEKINKISETPAIRGLVENILQSAAKTGNLEQAVRNRGFAAASSEASLEQFMGALLRLVKDGRLKPEQADVLVQEIKQGLVSTITKAGKTMSTIRNPYIYKTIEGYRQLFQ